MARLVQESGAMRRVAARIVRLARSDLPVHFTGPTGVGKTLAATAFHEESGRPGAFEAIECGSLDPEMLRVELYGAVRGAYTGCHADRDGALARADGGTVFLDEIAEVPAGEQARFLKALSERSFTKVGGEDLSLRTSASCRRRTAISWR